MQTELIRFGAYLTGHSEEDIEQMYNDWRGSPASQQAVECATLQSPQLELDMGYEDIDHEAEREVMIQAFDKVRKLFEGRDWIMEGRGCYPYNDDRYKEEVRNLYDEFDAIKKDVWSRIKTYTADYKKKIIAEYVASQQAVIAQTDEEAFEDFRFEKALHKQYTYSKELFLAGCDHVRQQLSKEQQPLTPEELALQEFPIALTPQSNCLSTTCNYDNNAEFRKIQLQSIINNLSCLTNYQKEQVLKELNPSPCMPK